MTPYMFFFIYNYWDYQNILYFGLFGCVNARILKHFSYFFEELQ